MPKLPLQNKVPRGIKQAIQSMEKIKKEAV